jgi:hypothetical protein
MVIHPTLLTADQGQIAAADTAMLPVPPSRPKSLLVGEIT